MKFSGKVAVITGASSGIGTAIAKVLAAEGMHSVLLARRADRLSQVVDEIRKTGGQATAFNCDVTDETAVIRVADEIASKFSEVFLLVNNAGKELTMPLQILKLQDARDLFELNVIATLSVTKSFLKLLKSGSSIINIASVAGLRGAAGKSVYSASKGAIISLTQSLALEFASRNIRVNAIAPGVVKTELTDSMFKYMKAEQIAAVERQHPLGFGTPEDIAYAVDFLASSNARWHTGQTIIIDGGLST